MEVIKKVIRLVSVVLALASFYGCKDTIKKVYMRRDVYLEQGIEATKQNWSINYALARGSTANDSQMIDGNLETVGKSQYVDTTQTSQDYRKYNTPSEAIVLMSKARTVHRIVVYSDNLYTFDLWAKERHGNWEKIEEIKGNTSKKIDLKLNPPVHTQGLKIRVHRTTDDAEQRRQNLLMGKGYLDYRGKIKATANISEFELYGLVSEGDAEKIKLRKLDDRLIVF